MTTITITRGSILYPHNAGQQAQADLRRMFGQDPKADNLRAGADITISGRGFQVKSARATVCHGHAVEAIATEYAEADGFLFIDLTTYIGYVMTHAEFIEFAREFAEPTRESGGKNGRGAKMRLNRKFSAQTAYLQARAS